MLKIAHKDDYNAMITSNYPKRGVKALLIMSMTLSVSHYCTVKVPNIQQIDASQCNVT